MCHNVAPFAVYLDSLQMDILVVERLLDGTDSWELGNSWKCANAGAGTPRLISPGGSLDVPLAKSWAYVPSKKPERFETVRA